MLVFLFGVVIKRLEKPRAHKVGRECDPVLLKEHNHERNDAEASRELAKSVIKELAIETREQQHQIINSVTAVQHDETLNMLPNDRSLCANINRARNKENIGSIEFTDLPMTLRYTLRNELFLLHDSGFLDQKRFLLFSTDQNMRTLARCKTLNVDGTFSSIPKGFYQLLSIFGTIYGRSYPLVYCILSDKSSESYQRLFEFIKKSLKYNRHLL